MNSFTFSIEQATVLDTLEAVLAIARRGNLQLDALRVEKTAVALTVRADDPDLINLFMARLHNVIGLYDIRVTVRPSDVIGCNSEAPSAISA